MDWSKKGMKEICEKYDTPFYVYDFNTILANYQGIREQLHNEVDIYFSLKSNNNVYIANIFNQMGSGIEIASVGELNLALKAGFSPQKIMYSGPGKTWNDLETAIQSNIKCIIIESFDELEILSQIAIEMDREVPFAIRINPKMQSGSTSIRMGGAPRQFGVDEETLQEFLNKALHLKNSKFIGIHVYMGTQILKKEEIIHSFKQTLKIAMDINDSFNMNMPLINLGGGFGVPYFPHEQKLDMKGLLEETHKLIDEYLIEYPGTKFIIESGRYLLATSGAYVAKILYKKKSKGETFLITDGGMHHHVASTFRGRVMRGNYPMEVIQSREEQNKLEEVNVTGVLCTPEDCMAKSVELPLTNPEDYIIWLNSGAYGLAYSPVNFLGHPSPLELLIKNGNVKVIRNKGDHNDLLLHQNTNFEAIG